MRWSIKTLPYPWIVLAVAMAGHVGVAFTTNGLPVLYPFIQHELGLSRVQVGLITSATMGGGIITALLGGWLSDRMGVRRVVAFALFAIAVPLAFFPLVNSLTLIIVLAALTGIAEGPVYPATSRAIMDWMPKRILGLGMSVKQTGVPLGGALAAAILPTMALAVGWRVSAALMAPLLLFTGVLFFSLYKDASRQAEVAPPRVFAAFRVFRRNRSLAVITAWAFAFSGLQFILLSYFVLFLVDELEVSPVIAGVLLATAQVGSSIARILWGAASDFVFGGRRIGILAILGLVATVALVGVSLLDTDTPGPILFLLAIAMGITVLSWHGVYTVAIGEIAEPGGIGTTVGAASTVMRTSMIISPPLFGLLVDVSGSYSSGWRVSAGLALVSTVVLLVAGRERKSREVFANE